MILVNIDDLLNYSTPPSFFLALKYMFISFLCFVFNVFCFIRGDMNDR